jgi:hypothetical protein
MKNKKLTQSQNVKIAQEEHLKKHPFAFNLLRMLDNKTIIHVNSLFHGYNCSPEDLKPTDNAWRKKVICNTVKEIC